MKYRFQNVDLAWHFSKTLSFEEKLKQEILWYFETKLNTSLFWLDVYKEENHKAKSPEQIKEERSECAKNIVENRKKLRFVKEMLRRETK